MELFGNFIDRLGLLDIVISGPWFTWFNFQAALAMSKLDRFLVSIEWDDLFNPLSTLALSRLVSDHTPILLGGGTLSEGPKPFHVDEAP